MPINLINLQIAPSSGMHTTQHADEQQRQKKWTKLQGRKSNFNKHKVKSKGGKIFYATLRIQKPQKPYQIHTNCQLTFESPTDFDYFQFTWPKSSAMSILSLFNH